jgi:PKHD-type hydroxylase
MNFPVHPLLPGYELFCQWTSGFSPEELTKLIDLAELYEFKKGRVGQDNVDLQARNSDITWLHLNDETHWIHQRLSDITSQVNFDKFQLELESLDGLQYTKYGTEQHYDWHTDTHQGTRQVLHRKLSAVVMLSDPEDYEGGELILNVSGKPESSSIPLFRTK